MTSPTANKPLGWYADPSGRHELRFWDGAAWTAQVADGGVLGVDQPARPATPPVAPPPAPPASLFGPPPASYAAGPANHGPAQPAWRAGQATMPSPPPSPPGAGLPAWAPTPVFGAPPVPGAFMATGTTPPLASLGQRFGAYLLDAVLCVVTLFIGYLIWSCITFSRGQTPAKSLLGHRVIKQQTGVAAGWGDMFLRNVVIQGALGLVGLFLFGIPTVVAACFIFGGTLHQTGWDRMMGTLVVVDREGVTVPPGR